MAERDSVNGRFAVRRARGKQEMMDLQLFADGDEAAAPALSAAQEQQAVASGTMKPGEKANARQETTAPEGEKEVKENEPVKAKEGQEQEPPRPARGFLLERDAMEELEKKLNYTFRNQALLEEALNHSSSANEHRAGGLRSNERLEFLGDSILGMVVADRLYRNHPDLPEGELTRTRAA